jgi:hypothetical protein
MKLLASCALAPRGAAAKAAKDNTRAATTVQG